MLRPGSEPYLHFAVLVERSAVSASAHTWLACLPFTAPLFLRDLGDPHCEKGVA